MDSVIYLALSALILRFSSIYGGVEIQSCPSNLISLNEEEESQIRCINLDPAKTVVWHIIAHSDEFEVGRCPPASSEHLCNTNRSDATFSRTQNSSTMVIHRNHRNFAGKSVKCSYAHESGGFICQVRIIHFENSTGCRIFVHPDNRTVSGSCYTERWFASDNDYSCKWSYASGEVISQGISRGMQIKSVLIRTPVREREDTYYRATCSFSFRPNGDGNYTFFSSFTPGPAQKLVGEVTLPPNVITAGEQQSISQPLTVNTNSLPSLVLICAGFEPVASTHKLKWSGVTICKNIITETCTFKPTTPDDKKQVTCSVTFGDTGQTVNASYRLSVTHTRPRTTVTAGPSSVLSNVTSPPPTQSAYHTTTTTGITTERPSAGNRKGDNSETAINSGVAALAGGIAGAAVVIIIFIIIIVVVVRRREGKLTQSNGGHNQELEEHVNTLYEPGTDPYEINDIHQPTSGHYTAQKQPALDTVDPTYEDHNLDSYDDGYAAVSTGSPQGNRSFPQTHRPSLDHDLYSDVDAPISKPAVAVSDPATQGDEYAVVEKSRKRNTEPTFQPDVYAQVNKLRPKTGGDVYAQVNKPAKRAKSSPVQQNADEGDGNYGEVQKPKPTLKSKPTAAVRPNPKDTSDPEKTSGGDDEYNVLTFHLRNSDTPTNPDAGQLYSHIGTVSDTMATP